MGTHKVNIDQKPGAFVVTQSAKTIFAVLSFVGLLAFVLALATDKSRAWHSFLTSYFYFTSLAMGGLFFTAIQFATSAGWSVNIRRFAESLTAYLPFAAVSTLVLLFGAKDLYIWLNKETVANDSLLLGKSAYLNFPFFLVRIFLFFTIWMVFRHIMVGNSLKQDQDGSPTWTTKNLSYAVAFLLVFALSYSFFSVDLMMSLQPHWFSTIFGVYCFAGLFQSSLAFIILLTLFAMKKDLVKGIVTLDHVHDLAKFLKAFTVFWAYIAFSQFMLIWYANLPEETIFYINRSHNSWIYVSISLLILKFAVPFLALLPRWAKRTPAHLASVCLLILVMQYVDLYWIVYPNFNNEKVYFSWQEIGVFLGFLGLFMTAVTRFLSVNSITPVNDPRRHESFNHHVTY